jgi:hypothetical protein
VGGGAVYEVRPHKDKRGVDLISDAPPFGQLWYGGPDAMANAIGYALHRSRSHHAVICVYDEAVGRREKKMHKRGFRRRLYCDCEQILGRIRKS